MKTMTPKWISTHGNLKDMGHWINSYGFYELEMKEVGGVSSTNIWIIL
jgi:hypothetical protein